MIIMNNDVSLNEKHAQFVQLRNGQIVFNDETNKDGLLAYIQLENIGFATLPYIVIEDEKTGVERARYNMLDVSSVVWKNSSSIENKPKQTRGRKPKKTASANATVDKKSDA